MSFNSKLENCKVVASVFIAHSESYGFDDYGANLAKILQFWTLQQLVTWKLLEENINRQLTGSDFTLKLIRAEHFVVHSLLFFRPFNGSNFWIFGFGFAGYLSNINEANFEVGLPLDIST